MNSKTLSNGIIRALLTIGTTLLVLWFLFTIKSVLIYLFIAAAFSLIARPIVLFLKNKAKLPNAIAVVITMCFFVLIVTGLVSMFVPLILKQSENLALLNTEKFKNNIEAIFVQLNNYFLSQDINILDELKSLDLLSNLKNIPNIFSAILGGIGSFTMGLFSVLFISFFLIKDAHILNNAFFALIPKSRENQIEKSVLAIKELLSRYFIGLIVQISILFIIYSVVLLIFGIENSVVIAFICALLNLIPFIGPLFGGLLMLVLTMTENLGLNFQQEILPTTMYVMTGYLFAQLVDNFASQPIIFSKSVKSHPLEIFLVIIIGGLLTGIVGMIFAVPAYTVIKVILKQFFSKNYIVKSLTKDL